MTKNKYYEPYYKWLLSWIKCRPDDEYSELNRLLHNTTYDVKMDRNTPLISRDTSREEDGLELRNDFMVDERRLGITCLTGECSMLEMLIALSRRIDDLINGSIDTRIDKWYFELIHNMGIDYKNYEFNADKIKDILYIFMNRKYNKNGTNGGLFPIKNYEGNMQIEDLYLQMTHYLYKVYNY